MTQVAGVRDRNRTHRMLKDAAIKIFGLRGFERAAVDQITEEAGFSKGAFYDHFESKEALFHEILRDRLNRNRSRFRQACLWKGDPKLWAQSVFQTIFGFAQEDSKWNSLSIEFMVVGMRDCRVGRLISQVHKEWREILVQIITDTDEYKEGRLRVEPDTISMTILAILDGFIIHRNLDESDQLEFDQLAENLAPAVALWFGRDENDAFNCIGPKPGF